jgi:SPP1 gp7 family putative phage head morphogenesis protein
MPIDEKKLRSIKKKNATIIKKLSKLLILEYKRYSIKISKAKSSEMLLALANSNMFNTKEGQVMMQSFNGLIQQAFINGIKFQGGNKTPLNTQYSEVLSDTASSFVSKLGETLKQDILTTIQIGTADPDKQFGDIVKDVQELVGNKEWEATRIVRTETMRATNSAAYIQAKSEGKQYWTVDNRDEACEVCVEEFEGRVFPIDDVENLPPVHPNCACVPEFHEDKSEAQDWADQLQQENEDARNGEDPTTSGDGAWEGKQYGDGESNTEETNDKETPLFTPEGDSLTRDKEMENMGNILNEVSKGITDGSMDKETAQMVIDSIKRRLKEL